MDTVTATEASRNFSELLNRVAYQHESLQIERGGKLVACIKPVEQAQGVVIGDLAKVLKQLPAIDDAYGDDILSRHTAENIKDEWES